MWTTCGESHCRDAINGIRTRNRTCQGTSSCEGDFGQEDPCSFYPCAHHFLLINEAPDILPVQSYFYNPYENYTNVYDEVFLVEDAPTYIPSEMFIFAMNDELFYLNSEEITDPGKKYNFRTKSWTDLQVTNISRGALWVTSNDGRMWLAGEIYRLLSNS